MSYLLKDVVTVKEAPLIQGCFLAKGSYPKSYYSQMTKH
jgi:hypothetical protein